MQYHFQSIIPQNFKSILTRNFYKLLWPLGLILIFQFFFPKSSFAKDNFYIYSLLVVELIQFILVLTSDSVNEIIINTSKQQLEISFYNIWQGNSTEYYPFAIIKVDMETNHSNETTRIDFYVKKAADFSIKTCDFGKENMESLSQLLYSITSSKKT
jgi:uncharacterized membrane protein